MKRLFTTLLTVGALAAATTVPAAAAPPDIVTRLHHLPGVTYRSEDPHPPAGFREFHLSFRQAVDHRDPRSGTFEQQLTLLHRDTAAPMVVYTNGHWIDSTIAEPTTLLGADQLDIEHRFFGDSVPQPEIWANLTVWQSAADEHEVVNVLKHLYRGHWLSAGTGEGGEGAIFHRMYFPGDFDGTFADNSPDDVTDHGDSYQHFLNDQVATPECRAALQAVQIEALKRRPALEARMAAAADAAGVTFTKDIGSLDKAYEFNVLDTPFAFWQFASTSPYNCANIPPATASDDDIYRFVDVVSGGSIPGGMLAEADQNLDPSVPFLYEAGTELGYPVEPQAHLAGLLHYPNQEAAREYVPRTIPMHYDPQVMRSAAQWVATRGSRLIFLYGSLNPWSANPFRLGPGSRDSSVHVQQGGDYSASIAALPAAERDGIVSTLHRWARR
ncbi:S28 family serine protease [Amycolatopsis sp. NPDC051903]|uniref:S28 family serine protease n=1 Tax=Amycolatopsis sp. NPDC051903 TaxID=3363936 RepID=UPI0037B376A1